MSRLLIVIGTRPQFIKYAALKRAFSAWSEQPITVDTGQHYDHALAAGFLDEFGLEKPSHQLALRGPTPLSQLGNMASDLESIVAECSPAIIVCMGDTNSTLAAALTGVKLGVPVAHIEAGERNFHASEKRIHPSTMPEEANRIMTDSISSLLLCASRRAVSNLAREDVLGSVTFTGDLMYDLFLQNRERVLEGAEDVLDRFGVEPGEYYLATVHRAVNTDSGVRLDAILGSLSELDAPVLLPLHPRTKKMIDRFDLGGAFLGSGPIRAVDPVSHFESVVLNAGARCVLTDSGGVVREAYLNGVPAVILDDTTAWIDLVLLGWATLAGADRKRILQGTELRPPPERPDLFGDGNAAHAIASALEAWSHA